MYDPSTAKPRSSFFHHRKLSQNSSQFAANKFQYKRPRFLRKLYSFKLKNQISSRAFTEFLQDYHEDHPEESPASFPRLKSTINADLDKIPFRVLHFCPHCGSSLELVEENKQALQCPLLECAAKYQLSDSKQILSLTSLREQLQKCLSNPKYLRHLQKIFTLLAMGQSNLSDSALTPWHIAVTKSIKSPFFISIQLNGDGVSIFKSSRNSIFPLMVMVMELPYAARISNIMLLALFSGTSKPPHTILTEIVNELLDLSENGLLLPGFPIPIRVFLNLGNADAIGRVFFLGTQQFNGVSGCNYCHQKCCSVNDYRVYRFERHITLRTHAEMIESGTHYTYFIYKSRILESAGW